MKKMKPYVFGLLLAWAMVIMAACGSKDNGSSSGNSSEGAMSQTSQAESSSSGTTQSGGGMNGSGDSGENGGSGNSENSENTESTGVIDGLMDDMRDRVDDGAGEAGRGAVTEESSSLAE